MFSWGVFLHEAGASVLLFSVLLPLHIWEELLLDSPAGNAELSVQGLRSHLSVFVSMGVKNPH